MKNSMTNPALCFIIAVFAFCGMLTAKAEAREEYYGYFNIESESYYSNTADDTIGGAIYLLSSGSASKYSTIKGTIFIDNHVTAASSGSELSAGGAIGMEIDSYLSISGTGGSYFFDNSADNGGAIYSKDSTLAIDSTFFYQNLATDFGGAISSHNGTLTISNSSFGDDYTIGNISDLGGAIYTDNSDVSISNTKLMSNKAQDSGGAIYSVDSTINITGSNFKKNTAESDDGSGGAIAATGSDLTISNTTFGGTETNDSNVAAWGGAIGISDSTLTISDNSKFVNNIAQKGSGGAIYVANSTLDVKDTNFDGNVAKLTSSGQGGRGGAIFAFGDNSLSTIKNATFVKNEAAALGGAISIEDTTNLNTISDSIFGGEDADDGNYAISGGAIYTDSSNVSISNTKFMTNSAQDSGGAIESVDSTINITGSNFKKNTVESDDGSGGAIVATGSALTISNTTFGETETNNSNAAAWGGAIGVANTTLTISDNSKFVNNIAQKGSGGAIYASNSILDIKNTNFEENIAKLTSSGQGGRGGAIFVIGDNSLLTIKNATFVKNKADALGGAISIEDTTNLTTISDSIFGGEDADDGNYAISGGAIFIDNSNLTIERTQFINNTASAGGAISAETNANLSISNVDFVNNSAYSSGGAINLIDNSTLSLTDVSFRGNRADWNGAAIYAEGGSIDISAVDQDVLFENNNNTGTASGSRTGIYLTDNATLNLKANADKTIDVKDEVLVEGNLNINEGTTGTVAFSKKLNLENAVTTLFGGTLKIGAETERNLLLGRLAFNGGTLDLRNGVINTLNPQNINFLSDSNLYLDVDLANQTMDRFDTTSVSGTANINVAGLQIISDREGTTTIDFANDSFKDNVAYTGDAEVEAMSSIYRYNVSYLADSGQFKFARVQSNNSYNSFNPAVYGSTSAMQGVFLSQLANYDIALGNIDQNMLLTQAQKFALKYGNKYAANDETNPQVYSPLFIPDENKGIWLRPYASVEDVKLDNGPKVENQMYGALVGGDTDLFSYDNGWDAQYSAYAGYNGSHQAYSGNGIWQNGGMLGITGAFFKGNFFEALTANVGASHAEIKNNYLGNNDLGILSTGIASKTGYNWEFEDGKFIIQPSLTMSYSFVAPLNDYTLKNGVRIKNSNLNTMQLAPGLKFIGNLKYGWQPYLNFRMVWNILEDSKVKAAEVSLPETSVKPYFEYGLGVQKSIGERLSGFAQAMFRAGGRIGAAFSLGFRWALGDLNDKYQSNNDGSNIKKSSKTLKLRTLAKN